MRAEPKATATSEAQLEAIVTGAAEEEAVATEPSE